MYYSEPLFVASLQSVYDAYDGGRATTHALQSFIAHVHATGFGNPPSAVLLVGDATYDPRGNLGVASRQVIPTRLVAPETLIAASDDALVDVDQDGWPDLAIGRLPVATTTELAAVVDKLVNFDPGPRAIPTPGVLVVDQAPEFTWMTQELQESLGLGWAITQLGGAAGTPAETDLEVAWATDPRLVMYAGHSGRLSWGLPSFLSVDDVPTLVGQQDLPLVVAFNCLSAYFTHPDTHSIGERMVLEGNAGAIAYWGPTAITTTLPQIELGHAFAAALSDPMILSIGEATLAAKRSLEPDEGEPERSIRDIVRTWILLGDPTTRP